MFGFGRRGPVEVVVVAPPAFPTAETGSFAHGTCDRCAWKGPGRRARSMAADDARNHAADGGCAPEDVVLVREVAQPV